MSEAKLEQQIQRTPYYEGLLRTAEDMISNGERSAEKLTALRNCLRELEAYYMQTVQNHTVGVGDEIAGTGRTEMPDNKRQKGGNGLSPFFLCDNIG